MFDFDDDGWKDTDTFDFTDDPEDSNEDGFDDTSDDFDSWGEKKHGGTSVNDLVGNGVIPVDWNKLP